MPHNAPFTAIIADSSRLGSVMLERLLAPLLDVTVCADGAALDLALRQQPTLLMIAHQWPGLDSLLAGLRQKQPSLAILLMASPESDAARLAQLSEQFAAGVIYRPYELRQVMREILALLNSGERVPVAVDATIADSIDLLDTVERDQAFCRRHQLPHALLALRIDEYPALAGQLGQPVVDQAEQRLFTLISNNLRREDHICRREPGGLILSLPGTPVAGARVLAHRLCQQAEEAELGAHLELVAGIHFLTGSSDESLDEALGQARTTAEFASRADNLPVLVSEAACEALDQLAPPVLQEDDNENGSGWQDIDALFDDDAEQRRQAMQRLAALLRRLDESTRMTLVDELLLASAMPE